MTWGRWRGSGGFARGIDAGPEGLVEEGIHLGGSCGAAVIEPPVEQGEEGSCTGVGYGGAACCREVACCGKRREALVNGAGEMPLSQLHDVANLFGGGYRGNERTHVGDVGKELLDGRDTIGFVAVAVEGGRHHFEEIFDVAEEEIVFVAVVRVEGGSADFGAIENVLDGDRFERLFVHQGNESIPKAIARGANAAVDFLFDW